ncbi:MAG: response regulator [Planctomycetes bacterium]|nr:response regulator [Planctomycetota bacterium]
MRLRKVLVVEDDAGISLILKKFFQDAGCSVQVAGSGRAALLKAMPQRKEGTARHTTTILVPQYDLITMDMMMPNWDGVTAIDAILRMNPDSVFVVISGVQDQKIREQVLKIPNVKAWIEKPFNRDGLRKVITDVFGPDALDPAAGDTPAGGGNAAGP